MFKIVWKLALTFGIFWVGKEYFSDNIQIDTMQTLIIATLLMLVLNHLLGWAMMASFFLIPTGIGCLTMPVLMVVAFAFTPIKLLILDKYLPGFNIDGFWTYVILTVVIGWMNVKLKVTTTKTTQTKPAIR